MVFKGMNIKYFANGEYCLEILGNYEYQFYVTQQDLCKMKEVIDKQLCIKTKTDEPSLPVFVDVIVHKVEEIENIICELRRKYDYMYDENGRTNRVIQSLGGYDKTNMKQLQILCETNRDDIKGLYRDIKKIREILGEAAK
jgi:galactokinase